MKKQFTIVVADDDLDDHELITRALKDCKVGIKIVAIYDGVRLMDYLLKRQMYKNNHENPDLILLDLNMPLMDGFQVLREIKNYDYLSNIPVFVITTSRSKAERETAMALGVSGFYTKGASSKDIKRIVMEICEECFDGTTEEAAE